VQTNFDRGVLTLSLDFELVWGSRDLLDRGLLERQARLTREQVVPGLLGMLSRHGMQATWATVGALFLEGHRPELQARLKAPSHAWLRAPWFEGLPTGGEAEAPGYYGRSLVQALIDAGQEVGSHGFSHVILGDAGCSAEVAASELGAAVELARELDVELRSFVFPRNRVGHLELLAQHGLRAYRGPDAVWHANAAVPRPLARLGHLAEVARGKPAPTVLPYLDEHGLWCIPGSASFLPIEGVRRAIPIRQRVRRATGCLERAAERRRIAHLWLHPINLASHPRMLLGMIEQVLDHAARLRDQGRLEVRSMGQLVEHLDA
jgi:peptidoglycan/xylan/chitin deacetylase (PgdA/CDA1 family)